MYHYTYMITVKNPTDARRLYIGVRSCKVPPEQDTYYGSCRPFRRWQKEHGVDGLHKQILAVWKSRDDALSHEVLLHDCFDVGVNVEFWNQAKQKNTGFDTSGTSHPGYNKGMKWTEEQRKKLSEARMGHPISEETKRKISEAQKGRKMPEERRLLLIGKKRSDEAKIKIRLAKLGKPSWSLGKTFTEEHKQKLSLAKIGKSPWNKNRSWSDEEKAVLSEAAKNRKVIRYRNEKGQYK
jgi:hypothetical protein